MRESVVNEPLFSSSDDDSSGQLSTPRKSTSRFHKKERLMKTKGELEAEVNDKILIENK